MDEIMSEEVGLVLSRKGEINKIVKELDYWMSEHYGSSLMWEKIRDLEYNIGCVRCFCSDDLQKSIDDLIGAARKYVDGGPICRQKLEEVLSKINSIRIDFKKRPFKMIQGEARLGEIGAKFTLAK